MIFVAIWAACFLVLTCAVLLLVGYLKHDETWPPQPHPRGCDCMGCGRIAVDRYMKKYEAAIKKERNRK